MGGWGFGGGVEGLGLGGLEEMFLGCAANCMSADTLPTAARHADQLPL